MKNFNCFVYLVNKGANTDILYDDKTCLMHVMDVDKSHDGILFRSLFDKLCKPSSNNSRINNKTSDGTTNLIYSVTFDNIIFTKTLINAGANINQQNNKGETALMI